jgi:predicted DNA-binding transcriptional regulator AlpA
MSEQSANAASQKLNEPRPRRRRLPQPLPPRDYLTRHELLAMVPLCMSTIDTLEKRGIFPSRFKLQPTSRVVWKRREVVRFMEQRASRRVHEPHVRGEAAAVIPNTTDS